MIYLGGVCFLAKYKKIKVFDFFYSTKSNMLISIVQIMTKNYNKKKKKRKMKTKHIVIYMVRP